MKFLIVFFILACNVALGSPVFNINVSSNGANRIIWPDHEDPHRFYILPKEFVIYEHGHGITVNDNYLDAIFYQVVDEEELKPSIRNLRNKYPDDMVSFDEAPLELENSTDQVTLKDFITSQSWQLVSSSGSSSLLSVVLKLQPTAMEHLLPYLSKGGELALSVNFKVKGYIQKQDGTFQPHDMKVGLPVKLASSRVRIYSSRQVSP